MPFKKAAKPIEPKRNFRVIAVVAIGVFFGIIVGVFSVSSRVESRLAGVLGFAKGVEVKRIGDVVLVQGEASSLGEFNRVSEIVRALDSAGGEQRLAYRSLIKLSETAQKSLLATLTKEVSSSGIKFEIRGNALILGGVADSEFEADRALRLAQTLLGVVSVQGSSLPPSNRGVSGSPSRANSPDNYNGVLPIVDLLRINPK